jgi:hypothetical protein
MSEARASSPVVYLAPGSLGYLLFIAVMAAYGIYAIFITGPAMRAAAQQQLSRTLSDENLAFCKKLAFQVDSSEFAACNQELTVVRQKQADRDSKAAQGLL